MFNTTLRRDATLADLTGDGTTCLLFRPAGMIPDKTTLDELRIDRSSAPRGGRRGWLVLMARRVATVSSKVSGKVMEVLVEEGMKVEAGQVLARLDLSNVEKSLKLAEAQ